MKYFNDISNLNELKSAYKKLVMKYHPDRGGSTEAMQQINNEYAALFEILKKQHNEEAKADETGYKRETSETPEEFINIVSELMKLDGLDIELCGCWLWIGGNTKEHKERLKSLGCKWSKKKALWSWHHDDGNPWRRGNRSMEYIRTKYGSEYLGRGQRREELEGVPA